MSTKIYHGYQLPRIHTLDQAVTWSQSLLAKFQETCVPRMRKEITQDAARFIDAQIAYDVLKLNQFQIPRPKEKSTQDGSENALHLAFDHLREDIKDSPTYNRQDAYVLNFTLLRAKGMTLCLLYRNHPFVSTFFERHSGAIHFPYWDNTDQPEDMTRAQWKERGRVWDQALKRGIPSESGLSVESQNPSIYLWDIQDEQPIAPCRIKRARKAADNCLWALESLKYKKETLIHNLFSIHEQVAKQTKRRNNLAALIYPHLPELTTWKAFKSYQIPTYKAS